MSNISRQDAVSELWRRGLLIFKCHPVQKEMYELFYKSPDFSTMVWLLGRQSGKSTLLAILALEAAIRKPNTIVKLVTDTKLHVKTVFEPIFNELLMDCPADIKPSFSTQFFCWEFPNGSQIQFAGSDGKHYERLRGQKSALILIDEAGFCDDLERMIESVLRPTTTHTRGKIILSSTPPEMPDHDFLRYIEKAEIEGTLVKKTLYDNPMVTQEVIDNIIKSMNGVNNERFRREYLCEIIKSTDLSVIPEFNEELIKDIVREWPLPPFFDTYEAMDIGFNDLTVVLFAYYDFRAGKVIVEDELVLRGTEIKLDKMVTQIKDKEEKLWNNILTGEVKKPALRVSDINLIVQNEISRHSNGEVHFVSAKKDDNDAAINTLRMMLASKKIIIHPRCEVLIRHLKNARWYSSNNKTKFGRSPDDGHYDAVDAIKYLVRHIYYSKNPYPLHYDLNTKDLFIPNQEKFNAKYQAPLEVYKQIFKVKPRKSYGQR